MRRYEQCTTDCTTDCGHCKGKGPLPALLRHHCGTWQTMPSLARPVDLVITDPPYANSSHAWDLQVDWVAWWEKITEITRPTSAVLIFGQGSNLLDIAAPNRKNYRYDLVWRANTTTAPMMANRRPLPTHQSIYVFYRKQCVYNPQMWEGAPSHRANRVNKNFNNQFYGSINGVDQEPGLTSRFPRSVLEFDRVHVRQSFIPSQKPVDLLRWLIRSYSNPGDLVLDPFAGVFSTAVAALAENRESMMCEQDETRFQIGLGRL